MIDRHQLPPPHRWRWLALILVAMGLILCVWQASQMAREQALNSLQEDAENELRLSAAHLNGYLLRYDYLPQMLATREGIQRFLASPDSQDPMPLNLLLDRFRFTAGVSDVYLLDDQGDTVAASNWHRPNTFIGQNYAFRSYYRDAIAGGQGRFYGLGVQSGERGYYFSSPVYLEDTSPDARPDGVVVIKVLLDDVEQSWAEQEATLLVTDRDDIIFMASKPELRMKALYPLSEQQRDTLRSTRRYAKAPLNASGISIEQTHSENAQIANFSQGILKGERFLRLTRPVEEFEWDIHILKPLDTVNRTQWLAALMAGGLYGVVALAGGIGWQRLRLRRIRENFAERERQTLARVRDELEESVERRTRDLLASNQRLSDEIEERRRAEENLRQTQDELIQAAKLAVLGQLAAGINHELNQPLAAIRAYADNARRFLAMSRINQTDANLEQIIELTHRMADISAQLRQFSRKSSERQENIPVQSCVEYALRLFHSRLRDLKVRVDQQMPETTLWVKGDLVRLEQVIVNLISNALQAMTDTDNPTLTVRVAANDTSVHLHIIDNGPGIESSDINQIFAPFFSTKAPGSGLGLGLSISSRIMEDLGGKLKARNHPTGGAQFSIILPLANTSDNSMEHLSHE